jgi:hypothetical protein
VENKHTSNKNARNRTYRTAGTWSAKKKKKKKQGAARSNSRNKQGKRQQREESKQEGTCAGENGIWTPLTRREAMDEDARSKHA